MSKPARLEHYESSSAEPEGPDTAEASRPGADTAEDAAPSPYGAPRQEAAPEEPTTEVGEDPGDSEQSPPAAPKPAERQGVAPERSQTTEPDSGLSGFLDTLDERARTWWTGRKDRRVQLRAQAADAEDSEYPAESPDFPKPPPPEQRPEGQLFTGAIPIISSPTEQHPAPPRPASTDEADAAENPADETTELPEPADEPAAGDADQGSAPTEASRPPRVRRALDEHRRREVILQKARAIEDATAAYDAEPQAGFADEEEDLYTYIPPYNLPSRDPDPEPTKVDLARRIYVSLGAVAAVISTTWMFGWIGVSEGSPAILSGNGMDEHYSGGWFSGEHALLSPDHNFYWLWPVISIGLVLHACFQWALTQEATPRQRRSGWLVGTASILFLGATASLHFGWFTPMVLISVPMAALLLDATRQFNLYTARSTIERRLTDGVVGLFFGFALVNAMSSVSVWLTAHGWSIPGVPAALWAIIGLLVCVWTAAYYAMTERGRITIALGLGWGMFWLIFPRLLTEVTSVWVAIGAAMGAFIVILATQSRRHRINHAERRAAMGRPLEDII